MKEIKTKNLFGKEMVSIKTISEALGTPAEVVKWQIERFAEDDGIKANEDYAFAGKSYFVAASGVIWLLQKTAFKDYRTAAELLSAMEAAKAERDKESLKAAAEKAKAEANKEIDRMKDEIRKAVARVEEREKQVTALIEEIDAAVSLLSETVSKARKTNASIASASEILKIKEKPAAAPKAETAAKPAPKKKVFNSPYLPDLTEEELAWTNKVQNILCVKKEETGQTKRDIIDKVYEVMNRNYGVVFSQERKDFLSAHNYPAGTKVSNLRLCTYNDKLRSIFWGIIGNVEEYFPKTAGPVYAAPSAVPLPKVAAPGVSM